MIKIIYFASLKTIAGKEEEDLDVGSQMTVAQLGDKIALTSPQLGEMVRGKRVIVSVNQEVADQDTIIYDGDEVALLPPFSGGSF